MIKRALFRLFAVDPRDNAGRLIFVVTLLLVFGMAARTPLDTDVWWHLRAGEDFWTTGGPVLSELHSYTRAGAPWTNLYWLAQAGLYQVFRAGGAFGLGLLVASLAAVQMGLVYAAAEGPALPRAFGVVLGALVSSPVWSARPQIWSLVLLALTGWILLEFRRGRWNRIYWLLGVFWLWPNLHPGFALGFALLGCFTAGALLDYLVYPPTSPAADWTGDWDALLPMRRIGQAAAVGGVGALLAMVNPNGLRTWLLPFQTVGMQVLQQSIEEWASPDFHDPMQLLFLVLLFVGVLGLALARRRVRTGDLVTFILFGTLGFLARRNFGPFAVVAVPVAVGYGADALRAWWERARPAWEHLRGRFHLEGLEQALGTNDTELRQHLLRKRLINLGAAAFLGGTAFIKLFSATYPAVVQAYEAQMFPTGAADWIEANQPAGNMLNSYSWGGYLDWRLRGHPVFVDGRTDIFQDEIVRQWLQVVNLAPGWEDVLARWQVGFVLIEADRPMARAVPAGWRAAYRDGVAVVLVKERVP